MAGVTEKYSRVMRLAFAAILVLGILLRVAMLCYNRCMWLDEASVARNVYERGFAGLLRPLDYYQYAPPLFLWLVKLCSVLLGYGEVAMRLWPLLAGVGAMLLMAQILRKEAGALAAAYPVLLMATGFIFLRYGTEVKQYVPDAFVAITLLWLAFRLDIAASRRFFICWLLAGSAAIWMSMPSVFVLAGVGLYYGVVCMQGRQYRKLGVVVAIAALWMLQFLAYYLLILKPQINSDYLQGYHNRFFLFATPSGREEWQHNWEVFSSIIKAMGGASVLAIIFHLSLMVLGASYLLRYDRAKFVLLIAPVLLLLTAAAFNQYSLIVRLTIFIMPLLYVLMGYGFYVAFRNVLPVRLVAGVLAIVCFIQYNAISTLWHPFEQEEITAGLAHLKANNIRGSQLHIGPGAEHAYLYYTEMHPARAKWQQLRGSHLLAGITNYDSLGRAMKGKQALLYTIVFDSFDGQKKIGQHMQLADSFRAEGCHTFIYIKP